MKAGLSLVDLAKEIERRAEAKKDYIAPTGKMEMVVVNDAPALALVNGKVDSYAINNVAHGQIAEYAGIPKAYYDRMVHDDPKLLATNVNRWLHDKDHKDDKRLVRTLDNRVRALLSDKFRTLENEDLAEAVLPTLLEGEFMVLSSNITETRLYIKAVSTSIERDVPTGRKIGDGSHVFFDTVSPGITVSNSEVGFGAVSVEGSIWTRMCTNLASFSAAIRKYHTGARAAVSDEVYALLSRETRRLTDAALWGQVRDLTKSTMDQASFEARVRKLGEASQQGIGADPVESVTLVAKKYDLNQEERTGILKFLVEGGDLTRYGVHAAVTRYSADVAEYDRATELERVGGQIIELAPSQWSEVLKEAA